MTPKLAESLGDLPEPFGLLGQVVTEGAVHLEVEEAGGDVFIGHARVGAGIAVGVERVRATAAGG